MNQEEFIKQINTKQIAAYRSLFHDFYRYLVLYAFRYVRQQEIAEDIVQEVLTSIWESRKTYNSFHGFRVFLYNAVRNGCLNHLRHQEVEKRFCCRIEVETEEEDEEYRLMQEEIFRQLYQVIYELPDRCRQVFELHLQGKRNEEIAEILKLSVHTVKTQKKKAMHILREHFGVMVLFWLVLYFGQK